MAYSDFEDIIQISDSEWRSESIQKWIILNFGIVSNNSSQPMACLLMFQMTIYAVNHLRHFSWLRNKTEEDEIEYAHGNSVLQTIRDAW